jgi:hypothetical protein
MRWFRDVIADVALAGNQLGVFTDARDPDSLTMQTLARSGAQPRIDSVVDHPPDASKEEADLSRLRGASRPVRSRAVDRWRACR